MYNFKAKYCNNKRRKKNSIYCVGFSKNAYNEQQKLKLNEQSFGAKWIRVKVNSMAMWLDDW